MKHEEHIGEHKNMKHEEHIVELKNMKHEEHEEHGEL